MDPEKEFASALARSGPSWGESRYHLRKGQFTLYETETYDQAEYLGERVPASVPDSHYVHIVETIKGDRIIRRRVIEMNPWDQEGAEKVVFDAVVDEPLPKTGE